MEDLRYPIGHYEPKPFSEDQKQEWINDIAILPKWLEAVTINLNSDQLSTPYRPGGWTVHQLAHHLVDSHINSYCRMKIVLTEDNPTVRAYDQDAWANTADLALPINHASTLLHALHIRMVELLNAVEPHQWQRTYVHGGTGLQHSFWHLLGMYAWHGKHHIAHIQALRNHNNW